MIELRERKPAAVFGTYLRDTTKQNLDPVAGKIPYFMKAPKRWNKELYQGRVQMPNFSWAEPNTLNKYMKSSASESRALRTDDVTKT